MKAVKLLLVFLTSSLSLNLWAQTYITQPTETVSWCKEGGDYIWPRNGKPYSTKGTYKDTIGYNIYVLKLDISTSVVIYEQHIMPDEGIFRYRDTIFYKPGSYEYHIPHAPCDTIVKINLTKPLSYHFYETVHSCGDTAFMWHNKYITTAGIHTDAHKTKDGHDSIYTLDVIFHNEHPVYTYTEYRCNVKGWEFYWNGQYIDHEGTYTAKVPTKYGCDSTVNMTLKLTTPFTQPAPVEIQFCGGDGYEHNGKRYYEERTFKDTTTTRGGCDSIVTTKYVSIPGTYIHSTATSELPYYWVQMNDSIQTGGDHYRKVPTGVAGCDTMIYHLTLIPIYNYIKNYCEGQVAKYGDIEIKSDTLIKREFKTGDRLDSIVNYTYDFEPKLLIQKTDTIPSGEAYTWTYKEGKKIEIPAKDTKYEIGPSKYPTKEYKQLTKSAGATLDDPCTSYLLTLFIAPAYKKEADVVYMRSDSCSLKGYDWTNPTTGEVIHIQRDTKLDTLLIDGPYINQYGSDSSYIQRFVCITRCSKLDTFYLCQGDFIEVDGKKYTSTGIYHNLIGSPSKIDSIHTIEVVYTPTEVSTIDKWITACAPNLADTFLYPKSYSFDRSTDTIIGVKYHKGSVGQICDSVFIKLHVRINNRVAQPIDTGFCCGRGFYLKGRDTTVHTEGIHYDTIHYAGLCDSIVPYYLTRWDTAHTVLTRHICPGDTVHWIYKRGLPEEELIVIDTTKTLQCLYKTIHGCDSIDEIRVILEQDYIHKDTTSICESELPYNWNGLLCNTPGDYEYKKPNLYCTNVDSTYHLHLIVFDTVMITTHIDLAPDRYAIFHGHTIEYKPTRAIYSSDTMTSLITGCDSIEVLIVDPARPVVVIDSLCSGDFITYKGQKIDYNFEYFDTIQEADYNCKIIQHKITKFDATRIKKEFTINDGDSLQWNKCDGSVIYFKQQGEYADTCRYASGCDSLITTIRLNVKQINKLNVVQVDRCYDGYNAVYFKEQYFTRDAVLYDTIPLSSCHCDSIVQYNLMLHEPIEVYKDTNVLEFPFMFGSQEIQTTGDYLEKLPTKQYGCDSIVHLRVTSCDGTISIQQRRLLCEGDHLRINGRDITRDGLYSETFKTTEGCDSIVTYNVTFHKKYFTNDTDYMYYGDTYIWHKHEYKGVLTQSGVYYDSLLTASEPKCDSIFRLNLFYYFQPKIKDTTIFVCVSELPYQHLGKGSYTSDSTFKESQKDDLGHDTVILNYHYRVIENCSEYDRYPLCPNKTEYIEGQKITKSGKYRVHLVSKTGLDSIYRFIVYDAPNYSEITDLGEACDSFVYKGVTYTHTIDSLNPRVLRHKTIEGCDSLENLKLVIHNSQQRYLQASIEEYEKPYRMDGGHEFFESGVYDVRYDTQYGCDSIVTLTLDIRQTIHDTIDYFYCKSDTAGILIFGKIRKPNADTYYSDTTKQGSTTKITWAHVRVKDVFVLDTFDPNPYPNRELCASKEVSFKVAYTVKGPYKPEYYDVHFLPSGTEVLPMDSTYKINETQDTITITMKLKNDDCIYPGEYKYLITFRSATCNNVYEREGDVMVNYPADILQANWDNVVAINKEDINGCYWEIQPPYVWYINDVEVNDVSPLQGYLRTETSLENKLITASLMRNGYAKPVMTCHYTFVPTTKPGSTEQRYPILVHPTSVAKNMAVHIESEAPGNYQLYNPIGNKCRSGIVAEGENTVQLPAVTGCYLLYIELQNGESGIERIIVH